MSGVYSGADHGVLRTLTGAGQSDFFGRSLSLAADANGDGHADVLVGASEGFLDCVFGATGYARLYSGLTGNLLYQFEGTFWDDNVLIGGSYGADVALRAGPGGGAARVIVGAPLEPGSAAPGVRGGRVHALTTQELFLSATPKRPFPGFLVTLTTGEASPGALTLLVATRVNGVPITLPLGSPAALNAAGQRVVIGSVPAGLTGTTLEMISLVLEPSGELLQTAPEALEFR